jgi:hypothetical protein
MVAKRPRNGSGTTVAALPGVSKRGGDAFRITEAMPTRLLTLAVALLLTTSLSAQFVTTVATGFNRPTWLDYDRGTGSLYVTDRLSDTIKKVAAGKVTTLDVRHVFVDPALPVTLDFGAAFGGGIAVEPPNAGCGSGPYASGILVSSTGANQLVFITDHTVPATLAARDDVSPFITGFANPTGIALSWNYAGNGGSYQRDAIYVADTGSGSLYKLTMGLSFEGCPQLRKGKPLATGFIAPRGVAAAPDGSVYVADSGDYTIRRVAPDGTVTLAAGEPGVAGSDAMHLNTPSGLTVNAAGELFIADTGSATIRRLSPDGTLSLVAGTPNVAGFADGYAALFSGPVGVKVVGDTLYVADTGNNAIRKIDLDATPPLRRRAF